MKDFNDSQKYIWESEKYWTKKIIPHLNDKVLKVGNGLGYMSTFLKNEGVDLTILDVSIDEQAINKDEVILYDGQTFPFKNNSFDSVMCTFVLHHTLEPQKILREMKRVAKRVIILEETYTNIFSKLDLVYRDIWVNFTAGQLSKIYWNSYFSRKSLPETLSKHNLSVITHYKENKRSYMKELYVAENIK
jgi:ubiquinone/menaquinone biosynthesis C-methylase UbiE